MPFLKALAQSVMQRTFSESKFSTLFLLPKMITVTPRASECLLNQNKNLAVVSFLFLLFTINYWQIHWLDYGANTAL